MLTYQDFFKDIQLSFLIAYDSYIRDEFDHQIIMSDALGHDDETRQQIINQTRRLQDIQNVFFKDIRSENKSKIDEIIKLQKDMETEFGDQFEPDQFLYYELLNITNIWNAKNGDLISSVLRYDIECIEKGVTSLVNDGEDAPFPYFVEREQVKLGTKITHHLYESLKEEDDLNYRKFTELSKQFHELKVEMTINSLKRIFVETYPEVHLDDIDFYLSHFDCLWV